MQIRFLDRVPDCSDLSDQLIVYRAHGSHHSRVQIKAQTVQGGAGWSQANATRAGIDNQNQRPRSSSQPRRPRQEQSLVKTGAAITASLMLLSHKEHLRQDMYVQSLRSSPLAQKRLGSTAPKTVRFSLPFCVSRKSVVLGA